MYFAETKTKAIIVYNNQESATELKELIQALLPNKIENIYLFHDWHEAIFFSENLAESEQISLVIFGDDKGNLTSLLALQKLHQILSDSMIIALISNQQPKIIEELRIVNFIYRYFILPYDLTEITNCILSAYQNYEQKFELKEKNRILNEIHRASMSLIGEHDLNKCLHKLMRIVIDNANAEKGYLILPSSEKDNEYILVAEGESGSYETLLEQEILEENGRIPLVIISYAIKTKDNIILGDAKNHEMFGLHPLVQKLELKSVLCSPLVYQGNLVGVLYLENRSIFNAFSPYTIELFRLLSAPAAIAIQNAKLYTELENKVKERTKEIEEKSMILELQKTEIQQKNEDMLNSINYAKRIQDAFLPKVSDIKSCFKDSFVFYKPKDIVSGDFFWFNQKLSKAILACADCTGHGIPGAFMSIMANTILRQIVEVEGIFRPDEILELLHARVRIALQQDETHSKDGMDIAICQIDVKRQKLNFAGARRPLIIIRGNEFAEIKPDKYSVGGEQEENIRKYTNHSIDLEPNDRVYVFTDGFTDQFSETNKKYQTKRFYQLLLETRHLEMEKQMIALEQELISWRAGEEQTDDILVIGFEL
jgi:serine phosphatase RsbU (regulator of sigma subunit)